MALVGVSELLLSYCDRRGMTEIGPSEWRSPRKAPVHTTVRVGGPMSVWPVCWRVRERAFTNHAHLTVGSNSYVVSGLTRKGRRNISILPRKNYK